MVDKQQIIIIIIIIIIIVCLEFSVTDQLFTKNTAEFYNSLLYIFLIIGRTSVELD